MNITKLEPGQYLSIVTIDGVELVCNALTMGTEPMTSVLDRSQLRVDRFEVYEVSATDVMQTEFAPDVLDADGNAYYKMGRPRPRNIFVR